MLNQANDLNDMKIYYSHGKESGPWGSKIKRLADIAKEHGCEVESVDYTDLMDPDLRVERLLDVLKDEDDNFLLVGSSMGGYVALVASQHVDALAVFLLAPAIYIPGYKMQAYGSIHGHLEIVHGWSDEIIPPEHSIKFAKEADCTLHLISGDHRLKSSIETVEGLFNQFLDRVLVA
jgi:surfactin synthase thioesterase subunit